MASVPIPPGRARTGDGNLWPGLALCLAVSAAALALERIEVALAGRAWLEPLVLAILIGTAVRTAWTPPAVMRAGIRFGAKTLLELAVVLLGASVSAAALLAVGPLLLVGIVGVVALAIAASFAIGRVLGLSTRLAILIACGNSICGNSAIAAVAPVIRADGDDVAASIAFTAVLGVVVVVALPLLAVAMHLNLLQSGALAGLTVYAVPQVIAASAPFGPLAVQMGTLVKLVRVLMLGPVCLALSIAMRLRTRAASDAPMQRLELGRLVPWFILGFLALMAVRSLGLLPASAGAATGQVATALTIVSMAALGLGVDVRTVARAGGKVTATVVSSLVVLAAISLAAIHIAHL